MAGLTDAELEAIVDEIRDVPENTWMDRNSLMLMMAHAVIARLSEEETT